MAIAAGSQTRYHRKVTGSHFASDTTIRAIKHMRCCNLPRESVDDLLLEIDLIETCSSYFSFCWFREGSLLCEKAGEGIGEMLSLAYDRLSFWSGCEISDTWERGRAPESGTCSYPPSLLMLIADVTMLGDWGRPTCCLAGHWRFKRSRKIKAEGSQPPADRPTLRAEGAI